MLNKLDSRSMGIIAIVFVITFCLLYFTNENMFNMDYLSIGIISLLLGIICGVLYFKNKGARTTEPPATLTPNPDPTAVIAPETNVLTNRPVVNRPSKQNNNFT